MGGGGFHTQNPAMEAVMFYNHTSKSIRVKKYIKTKEMTQVSGSTEDTMWEKAIQNLTTSFSPYWQL